MKKITIGFALCSAVLFSIGLYAKTSLVYSSGADPTIDAYINGQIAALNGDIAEAESSFMGYVARNADATATTIRGLGVNYAPGPNIFIVGFGAGFGINGNIDNFLGGDTSSMNGLGVNVAIMAGINLGLLPVPEFFKRMKVYLNFGNFDLPKELTGSSYDFSATNFGVHLQYDLIKKKAIIPLFVTWSGIQLTTGLDILGNVITLSEYNHSTFVGLLGGTWNSVANGTMTTNVTSIPIELSTSISMSIFTIFGGFGADYNTGQTDVNLTLSGNVKSNSGAFDGQIDGYVKNSYDITSVDYRIFGGVQLDLAFVKILTQATYDIATTSYSINGGIRVAF